MNRAVVVLLLLIANALVNASKVTPPVSATPDFGRFGHTVDGAALAVPQNGPLVAQASTAPPLFPRKLEACSTP